MGHSLECNALGHGDLRAVIGSGRSDVVRPVIEARDRLFANNPGEGWRVALRELTTAMGGHSEPAGAPPDEDQEIWLHELNDILVDIRDWDADLVTLYL